MVCAADSLATLAVGGGVILASRIGPTAVLAAARGSKKSAPFDRDRTSARAMKLTVGRSGGALRSCRWPAAVLISMAANLFTEGRPIASVVAPLWGRSSVGRALRSQCRGQGFDPPRFHQFPLVTSDGQWRTVPLMIAGSKLDALLALSCCCAYPSTASMAIF